MKTIVKIMFVLMVVFTMSCKKSDVFPDNGCQCYLAKVNHFGETLEIIEIGTYQLCDSISIHNKYIELKKNWQPQDTITFTPVNCH